MSVTQTLRALGNWNLQLREDTPAEAWDKIDYFGHIAIHVGRQNAQVAGDSLLASSRYTGVLRAKSESGMPKRIGGLDVAMWLGDPDNKSDIIEEILEVSGDFETVIEEVMADFDAVQLGTIFNVAGTFTQSFQFQSRRQIIDYICQTIGGMAWRVNGDATLDAGPEESIFVTVPECMVIRKPKSLPSLAGSEVDMFLRSFNGSLETEQDVEDLTTRVLLMAQGINGQFAAAAVDAPPGTHAFLDMHGNPIKMTRIVQESETNEDNAEARAQLHLNRFLGTRDALTLSSEVYDITGSARVGDYLWVYDPIMNLVDNGNEVVFRGQRMNPLRLQMTETTWPVKLGMSAFYRHWNGEWIDLTNFVEWETGETTIVVGGYNRSLNDSGTSPFPITQPEVDTSIPGQVEWDLPWLQSMYQSPGTGESKSEVELKWSQPLNEDSSVITDGAYYEIRFRPSVVSLTNPTISEIENYEVDDLNTVQNPIAFGIEQEWQFARAPWDTLKFRLQELTPGMTYEAQIRAVDSARPAHLGDWSDLMAWQASRDIFPPATPAPPFVASAPMAVLFRHDLGRADGGTFNLDRDLGHLEFHGSVDPLFGPHDGTLIGKIPADWGMITGEVPIVASFQITEQAPMFYKTVAVDMSGNKSLPSASVVSTAELIGDQYVRNLTVDKVTAGTISADWIIGSYIRTGKTGARVELSYQGIHGYNALNQRQLDWKSSDGSLNVIGDGGIKVTGGGNVEITDGALIVYNASGNKIIELGECADGRHGLQVYKDNGTRVSRIGELATGNEGIEVISDTGVLVRVDTLAFGMQAQTLAGAVSTSLGTYNGSTPSVTVTMGDSGRALVHLGAWLLSGSPNSGPGVSFGTTGATVVAPDDIRALAHNVTASSLGVGRSFAVSGFNPGATTFYMCYKSSFAGNTSQYLNRTIAVQPY